MAVQYDKENGLTTWLNLLKREVANISSEVNALFDNVISKMNDAQWQEIFDSENGWENFIAKNKIADEDFKEFLGTIDNAKFTLKDYQQYLKDTGKATSTFTAFTKKAGTALKSLGAAFGSMMVNLAIVTVIKLVVKGIDNLIHSAEHCKERVDELMESYQSALDKANSNAKTIEDLASRYEELSKGVDRLGRNLSLTTDEYSEYNKIANQIAEMFPQMVQGYTDEGNAILSLKGNIELLRDAYKEAQQEAYNMLVVSSKNSSGNDIIQNAKNVINGSTLFGNKSSRGKVEENKAYEEVLDAIISRDLEQIKSATLKYRNPATSSNWLLDSLDVNWDDLYNTKELLATEEELYSIQQKIKAKIQSNQAEINSVINDTRTLANAYLMTNQDYARLDEQSKNAASIIVNSINENIVRGFNDAEDVGSYVVKIVDTIKDNPDIQDALVNLLTLDATDMAVTKADELIDTYIKFIAEKLGESELELKVRLGFGDTDDVAKRLRNSLRQITDDHGIADREEYSELYEFVKIFNEKEVELWLEATLGAENATDAINRYKEALKGVVNIEPASFTDIFSLGSSDDALTTLGKISESIDTIQNAYKTLYDAIEEYNEEGAFSIDTLQSVIALGDDWLDYLVDEEGALKLDKESLEQLTQARLNDMRVQAINNVIDNVSKIQTDADANEYLTTTNYALAESYEEVAQKALESAQAQMQAAVAAGNLSAANMEAAMSKATADIDKINKLFTNTNIGVKSIYGGNGPSSSSKSSSGSTSEFEETVDFFKQRVEILDNALSHLDTTMDNLSGSFAKNNLVNAELGITEEKFKNYTDAVSMYTKKANEALSKLPADIAAKIKNGAVALTDFVGDGNKDVVEAIKDYQSWADEISNCKEELAELQKEISQLELEKFNNIMEDFENQFGLRDNSKNLISKQIDLLKEAGELIGESFFVTQIDQSKKQLELLENEKAQLVNQMSSAISSGRVKMLPCHIVICGQ